MPAQQRVTLPASSYAHIRQALWVLAGSLVITEAGTRVVLATGDGFWSSMQTMGLTNNARSRARAKQVGFILALIITVGFSIVPIFIMAGVITN